MVSTRHRNKEDWQNGNPCADRWPDFTVDGAGPGSLCKLADKFDPNRERLPKQVKEKIALSEKKKADKVDTFDELVKAVKEAMSYDDPGRVQHALNGLALGNGYKDGPALSKVVLSHDEYTSGSQTMSAADIVSAAETQPSQMLIPDLVKHPSTVLLHGRGGCGKTATAWMIARHVYKAFPSQSGARTYQSRKARCSGLTVTRTNLRFMSSFWKLGLMRPTTSLFNRVHRCSGTRGSSSLSRSTDQPWSCGTQSLHA